MAYISLVNLFICSVVMVYKISAAPHIIGGGFLTDSVVGSNSGRINNLVRSVISSMDRPRFSDNAGVEAGNTRLRQSSGDASENNAALPGSTHNETPGIKLPPPVISELDGVNPFLRGKREVCQLPSNLALLYKFLNDETFIGRNVTHSSHLNISGELKECPKNMQNQLPSDPDRKRSNCPWEIKELDLGVNAFPRYIPQAHCLCQNCIDSTTMGCHKLWYNVTYFERRGCEYGLALMTRKTVEVPVGCFCAQEDSTSPAEEDHSVMT